MTPLVEALKTLDLMWWVGVIVIIGVAVMATRS